MPSAAHSIETFHLQFARLLWTGPEKDCFVLKDGCNLRFFFESVRYSEDIDFDVSNRVPVHVLKDRVARILGGPPLTLTLRNRGLHLSSITAPKQTETTQRWKLGLSLDGHPVPFPTKIEFSRRESEDTGVLEPIAPSVLAEHQSMQFLATHYPLAAAVRQKVDALAGRREVQARDVFDLGAVLIPRTGGATELLESSRSRVEAAMERAMTVTYGDYQAQVVSYLHPDHSDSLGSRGAWDAVQTQVVDYLDTALSRRGGPGRGAGR